jgi:hypothetical protein
MGSPGLPPGFAFRTVALAPGSCRVYDEAEWRDALVMVERGEIELECLGGGRRRFTRGNLLWLSGLPLRALHNAGREPALLATVSRRPPPAGRGDDGTRHPTSHPVGGWSLGVGGGIQAAGR